MEIINSYRPKLKLDSACSILLWFSVITVIPSAILGFMLASSGNYDDELLLKAYNLTNSYRKACEILPYNIDRGTLAKNIKRIKADKKYFMIKKI